MMGNSTATIQIPATLASGLLSAQAFQMASLESNRTMLLAELEAQQRINAELRDELEEALAENGRLRERLVALERDEEGKTYG